MDQIGIVIRQDNITDDMQLKRFDKAAITTGVYKLKKEYEKPIISWLDLWDMAIAFYDYDKLLKDFGSEDDRKQIIAITKDLRIPAYNPEFIYIRNNDISKEFIKAFLEYIPEFYDSKFALIKAIWQIKPKIIFMPKDSLIKS